MQDPYANEIGWPYKIEADDNIAALKNVPATLLLAWGLVPLSCRLRPSMPPGCCQAWLAGSGSRANQQVDTARTELENAGIQRKNPDGTYEFTERLFSQLMRTQAAGVDGSQRLRGEDRANRGTPEAGSRVADGSGGALLRAIYRKVDPRSDLAADESGSGISILKLTRFGVAPRTCQRPAEGCSSQRQTGRSG